MSYTTGTPRRIKMSFYPRQCATTEPAMGLAWDVRRLDPCVVSLMWHMGTKDTVAELKRTPLSTQEEFLAARSLQKGEEK